MSEPPATADPRRRLPVAPGFNPRSLPETAPPVDGVRPWQWLADEPADPEEEQAYLERFVGGSGTPNPYHRRDHDLVLEPLPVADVVDSHLLQQVFFDVNGAPRVSVRLSGNGPDADAGSARAEFPFTVPVAIIGTVPPSADAGRALGRSFPAELARALSQRGIDSWPAVAADPSRRWVEDVLLADYTNAHDLRYAAKVHLQPFLSVWRIVDGRSVIDVIDLAQPWEEQVVARGTADLLRVPARTCPMIPGSGRGDLCRMAGGPWTSGSIHCAAAWEAKRERLIGSLGCDTCGDGSIKIFQRHVMGGVRHTHPVAAGPPLPSRHDVLVSVAKPDK